MYPVLIINYIGLQINFLTLLKRFFFEIVIDL